MKVSNLSSELKFINRIGQTLCPEERIQLDLAVNKLRQEYHFQHFHFWGRVEGIHKNYYVIRGTTFEGGCFPKPSYFWRYTLSYLALKISISPNCQLPDVSSLKE